MIISQTAKTVTLTLNGFHGTYKIVLKKAAMDFCDAEGFIPSKGQVSRVNKKICGCSGCICPKLQQDYFYF